MKCKHCNGTGRRMEESDNGIGWIPVKCEYCNGTGKVEITEQEYIQTCNTEQLANAFFEYRYANANPKQKLWMSASEKCIKTDIVEWLKQPHQ